MYKNYVDLYNTFSKQNLCGGIWRAGRTNPNIVRTVIPIDQLYVIVQQNVGKHSLELVHSKESSWAVFASVGQIILI